ncbi:helix-turn-helix domain-containing protein [Hymenobacter sp. IS2118]|uniref:helix-turn-helix domain-containing protein n=1 Tax=Hymenobacter sp. IS2118 TaxID=1505605 RepID=UPI0012688A17|nr:helix-turn-helix transcriptional regulator [Hymenobacter sp. IS2118]
MSSVLLGERLTQLRLALGQKALFSPEKSRAHVAHMTGVSPDTLAQLEKNGAGKATTLAAVLAYYQEGGVNLAWVLAPDNADIPMGGFPDIFQDVKLPQEREPLADLRRLLQPLVAELDAGPTPTPVALRSLLTQIQQGALHALQHLRPSRRLVRTGPDLRAYHRFFPPVPAQSTGWHAVGLFTVPYCYVEAGDFLPRCGEDVPFLAFNPVLENVPDSDKCGACRSRVDTASPSFAQPQTENAP